MKIFNVLLRLKQFIDILLMSLVTCELPLAFSQGNSVNYSNILEHISHLSMDLVFYSNFLRALRSPVVVFLRQFLVQVYLTLRKRSNQFMELFHMNGKTILEYCRLCLIYI